ncbi:hypothetical protein H8D29_06395 [PVC group bacterium]|nr:hypothetical protein [PVC group bacterium]
MSKMRQDHPKLRTVAANGKISKMVATNLATGSTAKKAADAFLQAWSNALGLEADDFIAEGPFEDGHSVQPIMYNQETHEYKFTAIYYKQTADGLPVYGSRLIALSRNVEGNPIVNATIDLRDVEGFKKTRRLVSNGALALMSAATLFGSAVVTTEPELMVYAGSQQEHTEPRAAIVFVATTGSNNDASNYQKVELVVDVETGEILHEKNLILHLTGNISGIATESSGADTCGPESAAGLPYARVTLEGNSIFADVNGDYDVPGTGTLISKLDGKWFNVNNNSGSDSSISQSSLNPNILHNSTNSSEYYRAEVNAYLQSNIVRDFALLHNPSFPTIASEQSFPVNVNIGDVCNAYYDGSSINFFASGDGCSNTAFSVIVHHEYGHHMVNIGGSGQGAYGEGMGDVMGVLVTGDNELARGFYIDDCTNGIRNAINNHQYPCTGEIHDCGQLLSGCVWDTLAEMEAAYPITGHDIVSSLAVNSILLHSGDAITPSITYDWLTLDDDDGDLTNGTPHSVQILAGFAMHNMDSFPTPPPPLDNDTCVTARELLEGTHSFTTIDATTDNDPYNDALCEGTFLGEMFADIWFSYTACETGPMLVSMCGTIDFDSDLVIYSGQCGNKTQIACNGDGSGCAGYSSEVTFSVTAGQNYLIRVGGFSGDEGVGQLIIDGPGLPCTTNPPCPADINGDGTVDVADLLAMVEVWGQPSEVGDLDGDGTVAVSDLLILIEAWGTC